MAAEATALLPPSDAAGAAVRLVHESLAGFGPEVTGLLLAGWGERRGTGDRTWRLPAAAPQGAVLLEVFAPRRTGSRRVALMGTLMAVLATLAFCSCVSVLVVRSVVRAVSRRLVVLRDAATLRARAYGVGPAAELARSP